MATSQLQTLRDDTLNKLNTALQEDRARTNAERAYLGNMALAQSDLRKMIQQVGTDLSTITSDDATNQVSAAALLIKMNVTMGSVGLFDDGDMTLYDRSGAVVPTPDP